MGGGSDGGSLFVVGPQGIQVYSSPPSYIPSLRRSLARRSLSRIHTHDLDSYTDQIDALQANLRQTSNLKILYRPHPRITDTSGLLYVIPCGRASRSDGLVEGSVEKGGSGEYRDADAVPFDALAESFASSRIGGCGRKGEWGRRKVLVHHLRTARLVRPFTCIFGDDY